MSQAGPAPELVLDLRGLCPPEPMERVIDALATLQSGQRIRMLIEREPQPLFRILERNGYRYSCSQIEAEYQVLIQEG